MSQAHDFAQRADGKAGQATASFLPLDSGVPPGPCDSSETHNHGPSIPGFRLIRRLGGGGMGEVFLAGELFSTSEDAFRTVALKAIRAELLTSPRHRQIMENDIRIVALLDHPNIVRILHVGPAGGAIYYTMPFLPGGTLAERIEGKPLASLVAAGLLLPVTQAIAYLHGQTVPVIHLDLKPGNVLLDADGTPHLADFGLARLLVAPDGQRVTYGPGGTPEYMAPEQFDGWISPACDIYGLGAILYVMLTGRPPFVGTTWAHTMWQAREQEPVPPRALNADVDRGLEAICLKCLDKNPERRYRTASALADDLRRILTGESPRGVRQGWPQWLRRHLGHDVRFDAAGSWGVALLWQAALSLPVYLSAYALLWWDCPAQAYWLWLLVLVPLAEWGPYLAQQRGRPVEPREREILFLWVIAVIAKAILFGINCPLVGPVQPDDVLSFFPASMAVNGLMLCLEARLYLGRLYIVGVLDFVAAIIFGIWLDWAPLLFTLWNSAVLIWIAAYLRRRARGASLFCEKGS
jgi:eukaryotic-like serine/threonine-protein kinase